MEDPSSMCITQERMSLNEEISSVPTTPYPSCDPVKSYCVASGRVRHSSVRRNLCSREDIVQENQSMLNQPPMTPAEVHLSQSTKKKLRVALDVTRICRPDR